MRAFDIINANIPKLNALDSVQHGIEMMEDYKVLHLPVIENYKYLGTVNEDHLLGFTNPHTSLNELPLDFQEIYVYGFQHIFDIIKLYQEHKLTTVAVLDKEDKFIGTITMYDVLDAVSKNTTYQINGAIIEILLQGKDYSLSNISRIIESNGNKIIFASLDAKDGDPTQFVLTLRLDNKEVERSIAALERHEYQLIEKYVENQPEDESFHHLDHFFKYLNM